MNMKKKAIQIEDEYEEKGYSKEKAEEIAWKTVNKKEGGGNKPGGSGRDD